ncbi:helix-turn-helix domain-containing protein [Paenibacillus mucilaginosus 3016]|uniref:Helix-turn-helix domain-containing protein n=1 Tax=Paenibacillus mucilaginosus 3016 TaxID=1116391 RepID=H6N9K0_9BACL|nr:helix-turn-helix domain-containing protein [Paenibacillus mucilaginosus 3016]WFA16996.1 AraC family transcriptional regulator [Paenibacillus mucilaginosus]
MIRIIRGIPLKNSVLVKTIFFHSMLVLILVSLVSFFMMNIVSRGLTKEAKASVDTMTEQAYHTADVLLRSTYYYFGQLYTNDMEIFNAMYGDEFTGMQSKRIRDKLVDLKAANPLIESVYIYNMNHDIVFSSESTQNTVDSFYDNGMTELLKQGQKMGNRGVFIPRRERFSSNNTPVDMNLLSIVYTQFKQDGASDGALVVNLNQQTLQELINKAGQGISRQSMIINQQGMVLSHSDPQFLMKSIADERYIDEILHSEHTRGQISVSIKGDNYLVAYLKSDQLGWIAISMVEENSVLGTVIMVQRFILCITGLFIIIAIVSAILSIRSIYIPVRNLARKIGGSSTKPLHSPHANEYEMIESWISHQEERVQDLQSSISRYSDAGKKELLKEVILGVFKETPANLKRSHNLGILLDGGPYLAAAIRIDNYYSLSNRFQLEDLALFKYAIMNIADETMRPYGTAELFEYSDDTIAVLINLAEGQSHHADAYHKAFNEVLGNITEYLPFSVTISFGTVVHSLVQVTYSWSQACQAAQYRIVHGTGTVIAYEPEMSQRMPADEYPYQLEKMITDQMKTGNKRKHRTLVDEFFETISKYQYEEIIQYLSQMVIMSERVAKVITDDDELLHMDLSSLSESLRQWDTLAHIKEEYIRICEKIMDFRDNDFSLRGVKVVDKVKEYIHTEYSNPDLTIDDLVKQTGMTKNHVRKIFNDLCGETISQYLSNYRFEKAKELLIQTDYSAARISEMVGIANSNYFYVSFKKYAGKSPQHYRMEHRLN